MHYFACRQRGALGLPTKVVGPMNTDAFFEAHPDLEPIYVGPAEVVQKHMTSDLVFTKVTNYGRLR